MDFTVEGRDFRSSVIEAQVLEIADGQVSAQGQIIPLAGARQSLHMPPGKKGWQSAALRLGNGVEALLPLPTTCPLASGDRLRLGCIGPSHAVKGGESAVLEVFAISSPSSSWLYEFMDAAAVMRRCGVIRANEYEVEAYPLKKVCKVSAIIFLVGLACFSFLMHLFTESMDDLMRRLPEALYMSAKFGGVSALVVAAGGGLYVKSSNDYNRKKMLDAYRQQFEQAMTTALPHPSA